MSRRTLSYAGIVVVVLAAVLACAYLLLHAGFTITSEDQSVVQGASPGGVAASEFPTSTSTAVVSITSPSDASTTTQPPPGMKAYQNENFHFSLFYADDLAVSEVPVAAGALVVLFKDMATRRGFEIFVTPYAEPKITQERFNMDEPSGVMDDPVNILIDGAPATEFLSTNPAMGTSREIWFLHGGFLYEVTTPEPLDSWLLQFMQTWQFI